jgi:hypothetical protein
MNEGLRLHLALCTVAERLAAVMEGARFERRDGYAFVTFPTLPIPSFNGVWPDEDSSATALPDALAEIEANGIAPGVVVRNEETPAVVETARELGLTAVEHMPGMVANAGDLVDPQRQSSRSSTSNPRTGSLRHWQSRQRDSVRPRVFSRRFTCWRSQAWTDTSCSSAESMVAM